MPTKLIVPGVYQLSLDFVNAFLVETDDGLTLIDTGTPGSDTPILAAVEGLGKRAQDIRWIVLTHLHADHTGALFALKNASGAEVYAHAEEAGAIRAGQSMRAVQPAPGWLNWLIVHYAVQRGKPSLQMPVKVEHEVHDGDTIAGGLKVIHTPGHTAGHIILLWQKQGGVLFLGDAASHMFRLGHSILYEDFETGQGSLLKIAGLDFEIACFSHGKPILRAASEKFRQQWAVVV